MIRKTAAILGSALALAAGWAAPAGASCAQFNPDPRVRVHEALTTHKTAFVGTVIRTTNGDRNATVKVEKIWKGGDIPSEVVVHGGPGGSAMTSVDRRYEAGKRYLFVSQSASSPFEDNACSATTEMNANIAWLTPDEAHDPRPSGGALPVGPAAAGLGGAAALGALVALVRFVVKRPARLAA